MATFRPSSSNAQLMRRLQELQRGLAHSAEGEDIVKKSSVSGMRKAIQSAPHDEGNLKRSIQLTPLKRTSQGIEGGFTVNIKYGAPQNFGWVDKRTGEFHPGKHFMEIGYLYTEEMAKKQMKKAIQKFLRG
ncbi:HK97 gp10 family phage protein [Bacillus cereus]|uniref:HK97 gp10 family phage protein n=1 Tax=Bacillus cereus TaxID=1396 RepID=UPI003CEC6ED4